MAALRMGRGTSPGRHPQYLVPGRPRTVEEEELLGRATIRVSSRVAELLADAAGSGERQKPPPGDGVQTQQEDHNNPELCPECERRGRFCVKQGVCDCGYDWTRLEWVGEPRPGTVQR